MTTPHTPPQSNKLTNKSRVMLIDDDLHTIRMMDEYLKRWYTVISIDDSRQAIRQIRKAPPDVIICDIMMPELDGYQVLEYVRGYESTSAIPFIFLTGLDSYKEMRRGMVLGADDFLFKPIDMQDVAKSLETQLQKAKTTQDRFHSTIKVMRDKLTYSLPHELRTPLFQIMGYTDLLRQDFSIFDKESALPLLDSIWTATERLHQLIENYALHLQLESIANDPERQRRLRNVIIKDAAVVVQEAAAVVANQYQRGDDLVLVLESRALRISEESLAKIITELADNAFKFSQAGQVVRISTYKAPHVYVIEIHDNGRGLLPEQQAQLGQPFMQFEREEFEQQGIGLGYYIALQLVRLHEGTLKIASKPAGGTKIRIQLPLR